MHDEGRKAGRMEQIDSFGRSRNYAREHRRSYGDDRRDSHERNYRRERRNDRDHESSRYNIKERSYRIHNSELERGVYDGRRGSRRENDRRDYERYRDKSISRSPKRPRYDNSPPLLYDEDVNLSKRLKPEPKGTQEFPVQVQADDEIDEEEKMRRLMGFGGFESTKGKKVEGTDVSAADVVKVRKFRQFMNRIRQPNDGA